MSYKEYYKYKYYKYTYNLSSGLVKKEVIYTNSQHREDYIFVERWEIIMYRLVRFGKRYFKKAVEDYLKTQRSR